MQLNYYWDSACTDYANSVQVADGLDQGTCVQYYIAGSWSSNIADCYGQSANCGCYFFVSDNCSGEGYGADTYQAGDNCADNNGQGFQSFQCDWLDEVRIA